MMENLGDVSTPTNTSENLGDVSTLIENQP